MELGNVQVRLYKIVMRLKQTPLACFPKECVAVSINIRPWQDPMQFGIKVPGTPSGTRSFPALHSTHETAPLFLYKPVILATDSNSIAGPSFENLRDTFLTK